MAIYIWLAVVAISLIIEFMTVEMVSIWFVLGGLIAMIMAACGASVEAQIIVFVIISMICILTLRKIALKFFKKDNAKTNIDSLQGMEVKLLTDITDDTLGTIKINDIIWNAKSNTPIKAGELVKIKEITGNKVIVEKIKNKEKEGE